MRLPIIAGNWKMNKTASQAKSFIQELKNAVIDISGVEMVICPPFPIVAIASEILKENATDLKLGAQDMFWEEEGAYTGEVSPLALKDLHVDYVIIGHSERRQYFNETDDNVNKKVLAAHKHELNPIICVGETLSQRESDQTQSVIKSQVEKALTGLSADQMVDTVIAYEPIWAIGTGKSADAQTANDTIRNIRALVGTIYDPEVAKNTRIQYGGSVSPENIEEFIQEPDIDGALVGGASLKTDSFVKIIKKSRV